MAGFFELFLFSKAVLQSTPAFYSHLSGCQSSLLNEYVLPQNKQDFLKLKDGSNQLKEKLYFKCILYIFEFCTHLWICSSIFFLHSLIFVANIYLLTSKHWYSISPSLMKTWFLLVFNLLPSYFIWMWITVKGILFLLFPFPNTSTNFVRGCKSAWHCLLPQLKFQSILVLFAAFFDLVLLYFH